MNVRKKNKLSMKAWGLALIAVAGSITTSLSFPQEGHSLKPFQQWSKKEANSVLEESAWVLKQEVRIRYAELSRRIAGGSVPSVSEGGLSNSTSTMADMGGGAAPLGFQFTLRRRSAAVARRGLVGPRPQ